MPAPKGNKYAAGCETSGRPAKFKTVKELQTKIDEYINQCKEEGRPLTITGLAVALDTSRDVIINIENEQGPYTEEFANTIKKTKLIVLAEQEERLAAGKQNPAGLIFSMKNNYGWKDKQEIEQKNDGTIEIIFNSQLDSWSK